jgi:hypothetical protein
LLGVLLLIVCTLGGFFGSVGIFCSLCLCTHTASGRHGRRRCSCVRSPYWASPGRSGH